MNDVVIYDLIDDYDNILSKVDSGIDKFRTSMNEFRRAGNIQQVCEGVEQLYQAVDWGLFLRMVVFIPVEIIDLNAFEKILKNMQMTNLHLQRRVCLLKWFVFMTI